MTSANESADPTAKQSRGPTAYAFRPDIQALRAIAVGVVVLFHLWPKSLTGGYVGVDVFFAISGFLITSHLLSEIDATGRLRPARFWARRVKRLQPAALLVLLVVAIGVVTFVPENLWLQFLQEVIGSALQVENWILAYNAVDYLAAENVPSPIQHFWTLSVEEQFYFALPLLLLLGLTSARAFKSGARAAIGIILGLVAVATFVYSISLTASSPSVAYFSTLTRAWEFAAGSLLAMTTIRAGRWGRWLGPSIGILAISIACLGFDESTRFPGYAATLPIFGALICLWSGRGSFLEWFGKLPPISLIGRVSYAIYLWHWPLLILFPYAFGSPPGDLEKCSIAIASVALSWASTRWVEDPIRFSQRWLGDPRRPRTVAAWSAAVMASVIAITFIPVLIEADRSRDQSVAKQELVAKNPRCFGAQVMDPRLMPCMNPDLPPVLVPSLSAARTDDDNIHECWGSHGGEAKLCTLGPETGYGKRLYAVGDSHNNTLIGVYRRIAENNNWRIDLSGTGGCYLTMARQQQPSEQAQRGCDAWRSSVLQHAHAGGYDAIIVTHSSADRLVVPEPGQSVAEATVAGLVQAWRQLPDVPIIAIRDNPAMPAGVMDCVARHGLDAARLCAPKRNAALAFDGQWEAALQLPRVRYIDLTDFYCTKSDCPPVIGNVLVYRDGRHLTASYAGTMQPYIEKRVLAALAR